MTPSQSYRAALEAAAKVAYDAAGRRHICSSCGLTLKEEVRRRAKWALSDDIAAAIRALPVPEDDGDMVLVPGEPTEAMLEAANREWDGRMSARSAGVWKAMIEAAGKP